jgi:hypothetical protein
MPHPVKKGQINQASTFPDTTSGG